MHDVHRRLKSWKVLQPCSWWKKSIPGLEASLCTYILKSGGFILLHFKLCRHYLFWLQLLYLYAATTISALSKTFKIPVLDSSKTSLKGGHLVRVWHLHYIIWVPLSSLDLLITFNVLNIFWILHLFSLLVVLFNTFSNRTPFLLATLLNSLTVRF